MNTIFPPNGRQIAAEALKDGTEISSLKVVPVHLYFLTNKSKKFYKTFKKANLFLKREYKYGVYTYTFILPLNNTSTFYSKDCKYASRKHKVFIADIKLQFSFTSMRDFVNWESRRFIVPLYNRINSFISGVFWVRVKEGGREVTLGRGTSFEGAFEK